MVALRSLGFPVVEPLAFGHSGLGILYHRSFLITREFSGSVNLKRWARGEQNGISREEMEVLFTFLAERYERRSVMISSNLVFSKWDQIFKDPMTTMAAIDRLVHHALILEFTGPSIRELKAKERKGG